MNDKIFYSVLIVICMFTFVHGQNPPWKFGIQCRCGLTKSGLGEVNRNIDNIIYVTMVDGERAPGKMTIGSFYDFSFILRPYRQAAFLFGFMPKLEVEKDYITTSFKVEAVPWYFGCLFYLPVGPSYTESYIIAKAGYLKDPKYHQYGRGAINYEAESTMFDCNYFVAGIGFDLFSSRYTAISLSAGYQYAKSTMSTTFPYNTLTGVLKKIEVDFSGIFLDLGFRFVL